jgi:hypothetical protein
VGVTAVTGIEQQPLSRNHRRGTHTAVVVLTNRSVSLHGANLETRRHPKSWVAMGGEIVPCMLHAAAGAQMEVPLRVQTKCIFGGQQFQPP